MSLQVEVGRTGLFIQIDETVLNLNTSQITVVSGDADTLNGEDGSYYLDRSNHTGTQAISTIDNLQDELDLKLDAADYNDRFLGLYASFFDLVAAYPTASAGDYAQVDLGIGSDVIIYAWDVSDNQWAAVGSSAIANTDALPEGSSNLYFTTQRVRDTTLTGFSATNSPIISTDNVVQAFGKAQGQINAIQSSVPTYLYSTVITTYRNVGLTSGNSLSVFNGNLVYAAGVLHLNDILHIDVWVKTSGSTTGTVQMRLAVNGGSYGVFWSQSLNANSTTRLMKVKATIVIDYLPNTSSVFGIVYITNDGSTRGTFTEQSFLLASTDQTQQLTLDFNAQTANDLSAGSKFAIVQATATVSRNT